jgi:predicted adenylyl cyclase CyaB
MTHINIEIKARCADQGKIRDILYSQGAEYRGTDHQIDVYFKVAHGRLKLRKGEIENFLIHYDREDKEGPKQSNVTLFKSDSASTLEDILTKSLGVLVVVDKKREIYFIDNVKFHLDDVDGLGTFVEIEAIDQEGNIGREILLQQCEHYLSTFGVRKQDLISVSYSDMLLEKKKQ